MIETDYLERYNKFDLAQEAVMEAMLDTMNSFEDIALSVSDSYSYGNESFSHVLGEIHSLMELQKYYNDLEKLYEELEEKKERIANIVCLNEMWAKELSG